MFAAQQSTPSIQQQLLDLLARQQETPAPAPRTYSLLGRPRFISSTRQTDPFVITRHLLALEEHLARGKDTMKDIFYERWVIEECNHSISQVGQWLEWSREVGKTTVSFGQWSRAFKKKVLARDWVDQARHAIVQKRMEGKSGQNFDTFANLVRDYQHLLRDSDEPLAEMEVKRILAAGLDSPYLLRERDAPLYDIELMSETVDNCANQAIYQSQYTAPRPSSRPAPRPAPASPARPAQLNAISVMPSAPSAAEVHAWLDHTVRLPPGVDGTRARDYLRQRGLCFRCRQHGHISFGCPTTLQQVASLSPAPVHTAVPVQALANAPAPASLPSTPSSTNGSVPLLHVQARLSADGPSYQSLVDSGAAVNVVDKTLVEELGLEVREMPPIVTRMANSTFQI
ncbi:hypothetical protein L198_04309 [Cryptococcus wingfieldii CBS 7118]|uniref:CCHC-type domain-containing protein n=1 Tax=Cryptococcus wingfieldii CBS 7118 TaxID=1295528 RepID=A0A1E3J6X3_9TREE|nr:hypothetical protein L198_04309 [Cryptococcus wingfieldii CBS 7118]ODN95691.1 hypothetical protein L198_04309 [Cryptococcus wingfieldii CBS 7118]